MFASIENFELWNSNASVWIGVPPSAELIEKRKADILPKGKTPSHMPPVPPNELQSQVSDQTGKSEAELDKKDA